MRASSARPLGITTHQPQLASACTRSSPNAQRAPTSAQQEESYGPRESSGPLHKEGPYVTYGAPESNATKTPAPASPPSPAAATSPPAPPPPPPPAPPPPQQPQPQSTAAEQSPPLSELAEGPPLFTNTEAPINANAGGQGPRNASARLPAGRLPEQRQLLPALRRGLQQGGGLPGCTADTIGPRSDAVNSECCDESTEDCSSGQPASCNTGCANVLIPYYDDCRPVLVKMKIAGELKAIAKLCHAALAAAGAPAPAPAPQAPAPTGVLSGGSCLDSALWVSTPVRLSRPCNSCSTSRSSKSQRRYRPTKWR